MLMDSDSIPWWYWQVLWVKSYDFKQSLVKNIFQHHEDVITVITEKDLTLIDVHSIFHGDFLLCQDSIRSALLRSELHYWNPEYVFRLRWRLLYANHFHVWWLFEDKVVPMLRIVVIVSIELRLAKDLGIEGKWHLSWFRVIPKAHLRLLP
jgi:hypothetical protein